MRKTASTLLWVCCALLPLSQGTAKKSDLVRGIIFGPDGKPAAHVRVRSVSRSAVTNAVTGRDGRFSIKLAPPKGGFG